MAVTFLLLVTFLVNALPVMAEWEAAYQVWNQTFQDCKEGGDDSLFFMPRAAGTSQLLPDEAVTQWSIGMYEWINTMESSGSCLPPNGTDDINHLRSLIDAAQAHPTTAVETVITAAFDAYFLWAEVLFASGQGNKIVIPGYRDNSTLADELQDSQDVIRNAFNLWLDNGNCRDLNVSQCEQSLDNSSLTLGEPASSLCGNLATEDDEECDDGNHVDGDGCSSSCNVETCPLLSTTPTAITQPSTRMTTTDDVGVTMDATGMMATDDFHSMKGDVTLPGTMATDDFHGMKGDVTLPHGTPTPLSQSRRKRGLFDCPDDCKTVDTVKAGSKRASNVVIKDSRRVVNPGTFKELTNGVALMAQTMTILGKRVPRVGKLIALQGKMANAVLGAIPKIEANLLRQQGAAIWIRVTAQCCKSKSCCVFWSRLVWRPVHNWFKCLPQDGTFFDANDAKALGANMIACIKSALAMKFQCSPGASRGVAPA